MRTLEEELDYWLERRADVFDRGWFMEDELEEIERNIKECREQIEARR